jgi:hypothetical protein
VIYSIIVRRRWIQKKGSLVDDKYDLIGKAKYFEELHIDNDQGCWGGVVCRVG